MPIADLTLRRAVRILLGGVVLATVAACGASIPESGPIVEGQAVGNGAASQFIRVIARPPQPGAAPEGIARGFLDASASFQDDYAVARAFLSVDANKRWDPADGTRVYDGASLDIKQETVDTVIVTAPQVGTIDAEGSYVVAEPGKTEKVEFRMVREAGEWRIATPPIGLLLSRGDVERGFRTYSVYFLDPQFTTLVPDPITVPSSGSSAATTLMRRLVTGPTGWLAPAVRTAVPGGVGLAIDSVPVDNGIAQVSLDPRVLAADDSTRSALSAQIVWTLRQVPEVVGVRITAGGAPFLVPGQPAIQGRDAWPGYDPDRMASNATGYAITARGVVQLDSLVPTPVPGAAGQPKPPIVSLAVTAKGDHVAGVNAARTAVLEAPVAESGEFVERASGTAMGSVAYGPDGSLWWVETGGIRTLAPTAEAPTPVTLEVADDARVVGLSVARDGTRVALLLRRGPRTELALARVERRGDTVRFAGARRIESRINSAVDVAWASSNRLAVLGSDGAGPVQLFSVGTGSEAVRAVDAPTKSVSVAAAPSLDTLVAVSGGGLQAFDSFQWTMVSNGTSPAYPD